MSGSGRVPRAAAAMSSSETAVQPVPFSQSKNCASVLVVTASPSRSSTPIDDVVEGDRHEALAGRLGLGGRDGRGAGEQHKQDWKQAGQPAHRVISSAAGR